MHPCMFYVLSILSQHYMHVHVHGVSFPEVFDGLVASSSLAVELGMLHSHILCIHLHVLSAFLGDLQQLCLQVVVLCNAHVQAFYAKAHLVLSSHEPKLVLVGPSIYIVLLLVPQSLLHHRKNFTLAT